MMTETLCGICNASPKKYKCPTCSTPYCSLACFKEHKPSHEGSDVIPTNQSQARPEIPQPPPPAPPPRYLKQKIDFSLLSSNPKFAELLKSHPTLLPTLQRIYGLTIKPDPEDAAVQRRHNRGGFRGRGRGRGDRGRGRGGYGSHDAVPSWTEKKGDVNALKMLKEVRVGDKNETEQEAIAEFIRLVQETFEPQDAAAGT